MKTTFSVMGMSCTACSSAIEKGISRLAGVSAVSVSLMGQSMVVDHDSVLSVDAICTAVSNLGYRAELYGAADNNKPSKDTVLIRFLTSLALLVVLMYFAMGGMVGLPLPGDTINYSVQLALTLIILVINNKFFVSGTRAVINRSANMDTLVALSATASFVYSLVVTIMYYNNTALTGHLFYDSAAMVVTLVTLGKWLEDKSKRKTTQEVEKLSKIVPKTVTILVDGQEKIISTDMVSVGDTVIFRVGDYLAIDGVVSSGSAFVDKSAITGESLPVEILEGQSVVSGSIVRSGYIQVIADKVGQDTLFSKIINAVRTAGESKAPIQKFVDRVASVFVPVVTAISIVTFVIWIAISGQLYQSFNYAISVLVISCPCALGLATPVAIMATTGKGASLGILFKDAEAIQKTQHINCVLLDKTATITVGQPQVVHVEYFASQDKVHKIAYAIESKSNHPLATCICQFVGNTDVVSSSYQYIVGKGAVATVDGVQYKIGNSSLLGDTDSGLCNSLNDKYQSSGHTTVFLADDNNILALFAIADTVKRDSRSAVAMMQQHRLATVMVTGDNTGSARAIAEQVGLNDYVAEVLPTGKVDAVVSYQAKGYRVAMVGDGINDSPAIKSADLGIAIGTGTDIAIDSADIVVVGGSLMGVCDSIALGKKSNVIIKENLFWAFIYNVVAIPVAAGALSALGIVLTPAIAAGCMCLSSLFVCTNALRITGYKSLFAHSKCGGNSCCVGNNSCSSDSSIKEDNMIIHVEGMMCVNCVRHVTEALLAVEGVKSVDVVLEDKSVNIALAHTVSLADITSAVVGAGYKVI